MLEIGFNKSNVDLRGKDSRRGCYLSISCGSATSLSSSLSRYYRACSYMKKSNKSHQEMDISDMIMRSRDH